MTKTAGTRTVHAVKSGITIAGFVLRRGETITLTESQVEDTFDRHGVSYLDMSNEDQIARWGAIKFQPGPAPEGMAAWQDDTAARADARDAERNDALQIVDRAKRMAKLKAIDEKYGRPAEQWSLITFGDHR